MGRNEQQEHHEKIAKESTTTVVLIAHIERQPAQEKHPSGKQIELGLIVAVVRREEVTCRVRARRVSYDKRNGYTKISCASRCGTCFRQSEQ
jgi:hypothetical protein